MPDPAPKLEYASAPTATPVSDVRYGGVIALLVGLTVVAAIGVFAFAVLFGEIVGDGVGWSLAGAAALTFVAIFGFLSVDRPRFALSAILMAVACASAAGAWRLASHRLAATRSSPSAAR
jgi:hypothetical protein